MTDDPFRDVRGVIRNQGFGSLGGMGADKHHAADVHIAEDRSGQTIDVHCDNCGQQNGITVTWDELIYGMCRLVAPNWRYDPQLAAFVPVVGCRRCNMVMLLTFTPDECAKYVKSGEQANCINQQYVKNAVNALRSQASR
jgi:hypothetical protein